MNHFKMGGPSHTKQSGEAQKSACINCQGIVTGNFCAYCGQKTPDEAPRLNVLVQEFMQSISLLDIRLYNTLLQLVLKPGVFLNVQVKSRQLGYMGPVQFFILNLGVYLFLFVAFGETIFQYISRSFLGSGQEAGGALDIGQLRAYLKVNLNYLYFMLPPVLGIYIRLLFKGLKFNYTQCLVIAFYLVGLAVFYNGLVLIISLLDPRFFSLRIAIMLIPLPLALMSLSKRRSVRLYLKALILLIASYFTYAILVGAITLFTI